MPYVIKSSLYRTKYSMQRSRWLIQLNHLRMGRKHEIMLVTICCSSNLPLNIIALTLVAVYGALNLYGLWTLRMIDPAVLEESEAHRVPFEGWTVSWSQVELMYHLGTVRVRIPLCEFILYNFLMWLWCDDKQKVSGSSNGGPGRIRTGDLCRVRATFQPDTCPLTRLNYRPTRAGGYMSLIYLVDWST